ncbi:hypothetical protein PGT21_037258 [Puccinia graminis f. sp. tritici]|uniref:Uncharacterized protein n=1 Tax=Puccinia graminis f. sp. tritici TaxID=56615 RepID=A0A5B0R3G8_PUCGR|nr:hypothetical protein PGT21_037258 [Puccinia graminis f. sp. tritici]
MDLLDNQLDQHQNVNFLVPVSDQQPHQNLEAIHQAIINSIATSEIQKQIISPLYDAISPLVTSEHEIFSSHIMFLENSFTSLFFASIDAQVENIVIFSLQAQPTGHDGSLAESNAQQHNQSEEKVSFVWVKGVDEKLVPASELARAFKFFLWRVLLVAEALMNELNFDQEKRINHLHQLAPTVREFILSPKFSIPILANQDALYNSSPNFSFHICSKIIAQFFYYSLPGPNEQRQMAEYTERYAHRFLYHWYKTLEIPQALSNANTFLYLLRKISLDKKQLRESHGIFL